MKTEEQVRKLRLAVDKAIAARPEHMEDEYDGGY